MMDLVYKLNRHSRVGALLRGIMQPITYPVLAAVVKLAVWRHHLHIIGRDRLMQAYKMRSSKIPLITVSNHHSCLDDFILFGTLLSLFDFIHVDRYRWTLSAVDVCFTNKWDSFFFTWGHGVPVFRRVRDPKTNEILLPGGGVYQPSMQFSLDLLDQGKWVHVYPQGRIIQPYERDKEDRLRLRWGIGRLIADCKEDPIVLPIWHCGLDRLNPSDPPNTLNTIARILGKRQCLTILIGEALQLGSLRKQWCCPSNPAEHSGESRAQIHAKFTQTVQDALYTLKRKAEHEHALHLQAHGISDDTTNQ